MSKNKTILVVVVLVIFAVVSLVIISKNSNQVAVSPGIPTTSATTTTSPNTAITSYTLADITTHASATSCWSAVDGKVYDLTPWISKHPGGSRAILSMCGKDASSAYNNQHGTQKRPANELAGFDIGILK